MNAIHWLSLPGFYAILLQPTAFLYDQSRLLYDMPPEIRNEFHISESLRKHMNKKLSVHNVIHNIPFILSGMALAALHTTSASQLLLDASILYVLILVSMYVDDIFQYWKTNLTLPLLFLSVGLTLYRGKAFYSIMVNGDMLQMASTVLGMNTKGLAVFLTLLGGITAFYALSTIIFAVYSAVILDAPSRCASPVSCTRKTSVTGRELLFIIVTAAAFITICSKSSPIYPLNDWVDANCYMTVGKSMLHGLVPYRDLYEQKGPLLYILHALAAIVSETTFIGVYFLEIIAAAFFLFFSFKIMKLYQPSVSVYLLPILAAVVYSSASFMHGDSAEELCLPLLSYAFYLAIRFIRQGQCPKTLECIAVGVTSSFVLWIKFSMLGFYLGWFCIIAWQIIRCQSAKKLFRIAFWIGTGVLISTIPILVYFGINQSLNDLWTVYFYNNLFSYTTTSDHFFLVSLTLNLVRGLKNVLSASPLPTAIIVVGLFALYKKESKTEFYAYLIMGLSTFLLVYIGGRHYTYYALIFGIFVPVGILAVCQTLKIHLMSGNWNFYILPHFRKYGAGLLCIGSLLFAFAMCRNTYLLSFSKSDLPQYQFAEIISEKENATLLNYRFLDGGFYTTAGIVPNCKYFCNLNIPLNEIKETQDAFIQSGQVDYVVTRDRELESDLYERIAHAFFYYEGTVFEYTLYQRIS